MKSINFIERFIHYLLLLIINSMMFMLSAMFLREYSTSIIDLFLPAFLIPQYIFGTIFFIYTKAGLLIKLLVPFITSIVCFGIYWLMVQIGLLDIITSEIVSFFIIFLPFLIIWEITYQILIIICRNKDSIRDASK